MSVLEGEGEREEKLSPSPSSLAHGIGCPVPPGPNGLNLLLRQRELVLPWLGPWWGREDAFHNSSSCQEQQQQQQQLQKPAETVLCSQQKPHGKRENSLRGKANVIGPGRLCRPGAAERREGRDKQPSVVLQANGNGSLAVFEQNVPSWGRQGTGLAGGNVAESLARLPGKQALLGCCRKRFSLPLEAQSSWDFCPPGGLGWWEQEEHCKQTLSRLNQTPSK